MHLDGMEETRETENFDEEYFWKRVFVTRKRRYEKK
jgi:hypothetical protein